MKGIEKTVPPKVVDKLFKVMRNSSDNHEKADIYRDILRDYGFKVGDKSKGKKGPNSSLGTNILMVKHPDYEKMVFKFALDGGGLSDNFRDEVYSTEVERYNLVYYNHPRGLFSVQREAIIFKSPREIAPYVGQILKLLKKLEKRYLLVDLSPVYFKNYGLDIDTKELVITDGSDMVPLDDPMLITTCRELVPSKKKPKKFDMDFIESMRGTVRCGGTFIYDDEYKKIICGSCGKVLDPCQLVTEMKEVDILKSKGMMTTGLTSEAEQALERLIKQRNAGQKPESEVEAENFATGKESLKWKKTPAPVQLPDKELDKEDEDDMDVSNDELPKAFQVMTPSEPEDLLPEEDAEESDEDEDSHENPELPSLREFMSKKDEPSKNKGGGHTQPIQYHIYEDDDSSEVVDTIVETLSEMSDEVLNSVMAKLGYISAENADSNIHVVSIDDAETGVIIELLTKHRAIHINIPDDEDRLASPLECEIPINFVSSNGTQEYTVGKILRALNFKGWN